MQCLEGIFNILVACMHILHMMAYFVPKEVSILDYFFKEIIWFMYDNGDI